MRERSAMIYGWRKIASKVNLIMVRLVYYSSNKLTDENYDDIPALLTK